MPEKSKQLRLVRDLLDTLLVARDGCPLGRADGLVLLADDDSQPRVAWIETGVPVLARRVGPRFARIVRAMTRRFGKRRRRRYRIRWDKIQSIGLELKLDIDADQSPTLAWERWLRERVFSHIPGGKAKE